MIWVWIALAGGIGAAARFVVDVLAASHLTRRTASALPLGSLLVNLSGSFLAGLVAGVATRGLLAPELGTVLGGGFLGGYTTFSNAMYEAVWLLDRGQRVTAAIHVLLTLVTSVPAAGLGLWLAS
ncbi:MAG: fluoride efflux transporter FluC [Nitriliruptoraceae bacterium]